MTGRRANRRRPALALCLLLAVCTPGGAQAARAHASSTGASPVDDRELAARILSRDGYQTELPGVEARVGTGEASPPRRRRPPREGWHIPVPVGLGALLEILVWVGAGAIALAVVVMALQMAVTAVRERRRAGTPETARTPTPDGSGPGRGRRPGPPALSEADELAAAGRYTEAVHALLVRALAALGARRGRAFPDSATSREILASARLAPGQRVPLGVLVAPVERAVFGGVALSSEDWERCRAAYGALEGEA